VKTHVKLVRMLNLYLEESSIVVLQDAERILVGNEPEAYMRREIGLMKEKRNKQRQLRKIC